jgi:dihydrofolate reductase
MEMTVDGVVDAPERWAHAYFAEDLLSAAREGMSETDTILFGRKTYDEFAAVWPHRNGGDDPFAGFLNATPKLVVSRTVRTLSWGPAELLSGDDPIGAVADLKRKPGCDVIVLGSPTLVETLVRAGLLDTLELFVVPTVLGVGRRLYQSPEQVPLVLADVRRFANGVVALRYGREGS